MADGEMEIKDWEDLTTIEKGFGTLAAGIIFYAMVWAFDGFFGLSNVQAGAFALVLVVAGWVVASSGRELSFGFAFVTMAAGLAIYAVLPASVQQVTPIPDLLTALGMDGTLGAFDALKLAATALFATIGYWIVTLRAGSGPQRPETVWTGIFGTGEGERKGKATQLVETYLTGFRVGVTFVLFGVITLFSEMGDAAGILMSFLGEAPVVVSNLVAIVLGWVTMVGELPVIGAVDLGLSPWGWLLIVGSVLVVAVGARNQ